MGEGATIWKGSAFECLSTNNEILLLHSFNSRAQGECNNGAIVGRVIRAENNTYTSQLTVTITSEMIGKSISCFHDSFEADTNEVVIGSSLLTITTGTLTR